MNTLILFITYFFELVKNLTHMAHITICYVNQRLNMAHNLTHISSKPDTHPKT